MKESSKFSKQIAEEYIQYDIVFIKFKIKQKKQCLGTHTSVVKIRSKARPFRKAVRPGWRKGHGVREEQAGYLIISTPQIPYVLDCFLHNKIFN